MDLLPVKNNNDSSGDTMEQVSPYSMSLPNETIPQKLDTPGIQSGLEGTCEDEPLVGHQQSRINNRATMLKVIGPCHSTLITSEIDPIHKETKELSNIVRRNIKYIL
ncbi:hypothetical protein O181_022738 [Austropuccinia psidii MF-1]|uniref:Uncharacterized protein n=1 Tax=Austropuccinia psidii MF-1 TaxID=1389203 RepID=A0A9Q3GWM8_9BASI|nr:hypothetical protein [Austropuccinia psidii MF-1]